MTRLRSASPGRTAIPVLPSALAPGHRVAAL